MSGRTGWWRLMRGAAELSLPYGVTLRKVLTGELRGEQRDGKWYVDPESIRRYQKQRTNEGTASQVGAAY